MRVTSLFAAVAGWMFVLGSTAASGAEPAIVNSADAKWTHDAGDPPGSESIMLRADPQTGGIELLVRFPAGYVFAPHWHESNERIIVLEGRLAIGQGQKAKHLDPGGYAFLPAREVQHLSCVSQTRCAFFLAWDGNPKSHKGPVNP